MKHLLIIISSALIILNSGCDKIFQIPEHPTDEYGLPEYSETGRGTWACLVDGEPWIAERKWGLSKSPTGAIYTRSKYFFGGGTDTVNNISIGMSFHIDSINPIKKYYILHDSTYRAGDLTDYTKCRERYNKPIDYDKNWIDVTHFDADYGILSGFFEFKLVNDWDTTCLDTFHLTQGRFDIAFRYVN